jgi:DNA polymerase
MTKPITPLFIRVLCEGGPVHGATRGSIPLAVGSPGFRVGGIGVAYPGGDAEFRQDIFEALRDLRNRHGAMLDGDQTAVVMYNAPLEYYVLYHKYGQVIRPIVDLRFMSHLLTGYSDDAGLAALAARCGLVPQEQANATVAGAVDVNATVAELGVMRSLFDYLWPQVMRTPTEATIMAHTVRMFVEGPLRIDAEAVEKGMASLNGGLAQVLGESQLSEAADLSSGGLQKLLAGALAATGRAVPMKEGSQRSIPALSQYDEQMQMLLHDQDARVRQLARLVLLVPLARRFGQDFEHLRHLGSAANGRGHFELMYHRQVHGRFAGSGGFNILAVPHAANQRDELLRGAAGHMRRAIAAPEGMVLVATDASQIEARVLAWLSGEDGLHRAFASGVDVYSSFASGVLGEPVRKPKDGDPDYDRMKALRTVGKTAILGLGYQMGAARFRKTLAEKPETAQLVATGALTDENCISIVDGYRAAYPRITEFWQDVDSAFSLAVYGRKSSVRGVRFSGDRKTVCIELPSGRRLLYPDSRLVPGEVRERHYIDGNGNDVCSTNAQQQLVYGDGHEKLYGGKITEHIVSGIARDILIHAIVWLEKRGWGVVNHCYDEIICVTEPSSAAGCLADMVLAWRNVPAWASGLVLDAEGGGGRNFGEID